MVDFWSHRVVYMMTLMLWNTQLMRAMNFIKCCPFGLSPLDIVKFALLIKSHPLLSASFRWKTIYFTIFQSSLLDVLDDRNFSITMKRWIVGRNSDFNTSAAAPSSLSGSSAASPFKLMSFSSTGRCADIKENQWLSTRRRPRFHTDCTSTSAAGVKGGEGTARAAEVKVLQVF